jgi:tankyrase
MTDPLTVLVDAVSRGDVEAASAILAADPALARQDQGGATPLHYAAVHGQTSAVDLLIDHGADLQALDQEYGAAPIGWANEKGYTDLVLHMRARGARVSLHTAAAFGFLEDVASLAAEHPEQLNLPVGYGTPLHLAALWGHDTIVERLLALGADPSRRNQDGELPVSIASARVRRRLADADCHSGTSEGDRGRVSPRGGPAARSDTGAGVKGTVPLPLAGHSPREASA